MSNRDYDQFIASKVRRHESAGFNPLPLNAHLFAESLKERAKVDRQRKQAWDRAQAERRAKRPL